MNAKLSVSPRSRRVLAPSLTLIVTYMCIRVPLSVYGRASWFSCHVYIGFLVLDTIDLVGLHPPRSP